MLLLVEIKYFNWMINKIKYVIDFETLLDKLTINYLDKKLKITLYIYTHLYLYNLI